MPGSVAARDGAIQAGSFAAIVYTPRVTTLRPVMLALLLAALVPCPARADEAIGWATSQATELTRQGREHAARGESEIAMRRYLDAINFDPTYGAAYLSLGALQEAVGDPREAERTYSTGLDHVTGFAEGHRARARLRIRQKRVMEAVGDLEAAVGYQPADVGSLRELASAYVSVGALPAALMVTRRVAAVAEEAGETKVVGEAKVSARALSLLVGAVDPVVAGARGRGAVRNALAGLARRR
jgi:tetratricopeptide (TPR) repeat protein